MQKSFNILPVSILTVFFLLVQFIFTPNLTFSQELIWNHTGGPMGGIIGGMDINSNGDIYAGVYPFMIAYTGLYKSTNNGESWTKIETQFEDFKVFSVYITKEGHIWVGTDYQGVLYRSTDNGITWQNKRNGFNANEGWAIGESKDGVLFAGDANVGRLYRSTDSGENWVFSANIAPLSFAVDSNNIVYAGSFNGLYISTNNGITWTQNNYLAGYIIPTVITDNNNNVYCGTGYTYPYLNGDGLFYSNDGGQNWEQLGFADEVVLALAFDSDLNLFAGTLEDGLFKTTDMGQRWTQYQNGIYKKEVYRLVLNQQDDIFIGSEGGGNGWSFYGGGGVFRSTNGGELFEQVGLPISLVKNIVFCGDSLIITSNPSGVQKYNRFTKKWKNIGLHNVEAVTITPSDYLYAATRDDGLYKSTDLGNNWSLTNLTIDTLMPVYNVLAINDDTLFAATFYNLRRSFDGGENWNVLPIGTEEYARGLFVNNEILWLMGYVSGYKFYKTSDFGNSFDLLYSGYSSSNAVNKPISALNNEYIFLAMRGNNPNGILRSTDGGETWEQVLFRRVATVLTNTDGLILTGSTVASIYDTNKIYLSNNYGNSWDSLAQPTKWGIYITDMVKDKAKKYFFGTSGDGLYEIEIITGVEEQWAQIFHSNLFQNFPNPFNPKTSIQYSVSGRQFISLKVYDLLGSEVATLVNEEKQAGNYEIEFDASNLTSGIYFYQMKTGELTHTKKMILLK